MNVTRRTGRPLGSSAGTHISVARSNRSSWRLTIGKELWRHPQIGSPRRVTLNRHGMVLHIAPVDPDEMDEDESIGYAVSGGDTLTASRISIGKDLAQAEYGLTERIYEQCHIRSGEIMVFL